MAVEQDIWIVGAPEVNCDNDRGGIDRVTFAQLGLTPRATDPNAQQARAITDALAARYGIVGTKLRDDYLARATSRSRSGEGELIIYPRTMTREQAETMISAARAES